MKSFRIIPMLMAAVMLFSGCDFFRSLAGKPTSKDLERMKQEALEQARKQRELDSVNKANALRLEAEKAEEEKVHLLDENAGRYHVILGSFKVEGNAEKMSSMLVTKGYAPKKILFNNGFELVSVYVTDNYRKAMTELEKLLEFEFCPEDVWIYDIHQNLHAK